MNGSNRWPALSARLRGAREATSLQQVTLAAHLGVHRSVVSQYERGLVRPRRLILERYVTVLGIDLGELLVLARYVPPATPAVD